MFIKLTKKDGSPVWINASFLVTVEPSRFGGSVVVPIGDGLDYDVREKPEEILELASGAPAPAVVPVPPPAALAVSRDPAPEEPAPAEPAESAEPAPAAEAPKRKRAVRKTKSAKAAEEASSEDAPPPEEGEKPAKKAAKPRAKAAAKKPKFEFPDDYLARLRKLAPGSVRKFNNTLLSQFKIDDPEPVMLYLVDRKVIALENDHVIWLEPDPATIPENVADLVVG